MTWTLTPALAAAGVQNLNKNRTTNVSIRPNVGPQQRKITSIRSSSPTLNVTGPSVGSSAKISGPQRPADFAPPQAPAAAPQFDWSKYGVADPRSGTDRGSIDHNIDRLYQSTVGRNADDAGRDYWRGKIQSGVDNYGTIMSGLTGSDEYKDRLLMVQNNPNVSEEALDNLSSAYRSGLVDRAQVNADGSVAPDPSIAGDYYGANIQPNMGPLPPQPQQDSGRWDELFGAISGLQGQIGGYQNRLNDLQKAYDQQELDMQNQWNNMMWDQNRPQNLSVRGVRTQNELPGWRPRTQGTGFFSRGAGTGLKTSSINI